MDKGADLADGMDKAEVVLPLMSFAIVENTEKTIFLGSLRAGEKPVDEIPDAISFPDLLKTVKWTIASLGNEPVSISISPEGLCFKSSSLIKTKTSALYFLLK